MLDLKSRGLQMILRETEGECQVVCAVSVMGYYKCSLILTLTVWGMMGQVSTKGLRKSVAKALTRRQMLTVRAATEAGPDLYLFWDLFAVSLSQLG